MLPAPAPTGPRIYKDTAPAWTYPCTATTAAHPLPPSGDSDYQSTHAVQWVLTMHRPHLRDRSLE